jgi:hypothetical protein
MAEDEVDTVLNSLREIQPGHDEVFSSESLLIATKSNQPASQYGKIPHFPPDKQ